MAVSAASLWELILKHRKGKLALPDTPLHTEIEREGFKLLPIQVDHLEASRALQLEHGNPFDLLLVATARHEGRKLLTRDRKLLASGLKWLQGV